jgi:hypothetical protein
MPQTFFSFILDAYMQWFHIGSYRLAGFFSQQGVVHAPRGFISTIKNGVLWACQKQSHLTISRF